MLTWLAIAAFFAVARSPLAAWVQRRMLGNRRRALATFLVFLVVSLGLGGLITAFAIPLVREGTRFAGQLPELIDQARAGQGPVGRLLERTNALVWMEDNQDRIDSFVNGLTAPAAGVLRTAATGTTGAATVFVLAYLMALEGPKAVDGAISVFTPATGTRIRRASADCARSVTGYLTGHLLISIICGVLTYVVLLVLGVPLRRPHRALRGARRPGARGGRDHRRDRGRACRIPALSPWASPSWRSSCSSSSRTT